MLMFIEVKTLCKKYISILNMFTFDAFLVREAAKKVPRLMARPLKKWGGGKSKKFEMHGMAIHKFEFF